MEIINITSTYNKEENKHKEISSIYGNKGEEKALRNSEKKEKSRDGYVRMHECGKKISFNV